MNILRLRSKWVHLILWKKILLISSSGNLSCLLFRSHFDKNRNTNVGFPVFVSSLCVSDLCMGLYLLIIGVADQVLRGSYLWKENTWKRHVVCKVSPSIMIIMITRSIHRTQSPLCLWHLTLWCDNDLSSRSRKLMSFDVAYCIVLWYQVWYLWV